MSNSFDRTTGSRRTWWIVGGGCVLALVCLCAAAVIAVLVVPNTTIAQLRQLAGISGGSSASIDYVPTTAPFFAVVNPSFTQAASAKKVLDILGKNPVFRKQLDDLTNRGAGQGSDFSFERDVAPWVGTEIAVAMVDAPGTSSNSSATPPGFILMAATRDQAKSDDTLKRLRSAQEAKGTTFTEEQYKGATITSGKPGGSSAAGSGSAFTTYQGIVMLAANGDAIKKAIDTKLGGAQANLASMPGYKSILAKLPTDRALALYIDSAAFAKNAEQAASSAAVKTGLDALVGSGFAVGFTDDGMRIDAVVVYDPNKLQGAAKTLLTSGQPNANKVLDAVPASSLGLISGQNLKLVWDYYREVLGQDPKAKQQLEQSLKDIKTQTDVDVDADIFSWMTGEFALDVVPAKPLKAAGPAAPSAGLLILIEAKDPTTVKAKLDKLSLAASKQGITFASRKISGADMQMVQGMEVQGVTAGYGLVDNFVLIGSADDVLAAGVDAKKTPLSQDNEFRLGAKLFPKPDAGVAYFSLPAIITIAKGTMSKSALADFQTNAEPALAPFKSISVSAGVTTDAVQSSVIFVHIGE